VDGCEQFGSTTVGDHGRSEGMDADDADNIFIFGGYIFGDRELNVAG
jgi:hypothetical protein